MFCSFFRNEMSEQQGKYRKKTFQQPKTTVVDTNQNKERDSNAEK